METTEDIIEIIGANPGTTSIIIAGIHGDERGGIDAFEEIIPNLKIENGRVIFMYGNPEAIKLNKRFTEANLNRMFNEDSAILDEQKNSYEYKRAQCIKKYLDQADVLLDIHSSFTPKSRPFVIAEQNSSEVTKFLPFDLIVSGFDAIEPGGTDYYMNSKGKIGICIECGYLDDPKTKNIAKESILTFLKIQGHMQNEDVLSQSNQSFVQIDTLYHTKTDNFILSKEFEDFEEITTGQILATDGQTQITATKNGVILFARNRSSINDEGFLSGEYKKNLV